MAGVVAWIFTTAADVALRVRFNWPLVSGVRAVHCPSHGALLVMTAPPNVTPLVAATLPPGAVRNMAEALPEANPFGTIVTAASRAPVPCS